MCYVFGSETNPCNGVRRVNTALFLDPSKFIIRGCDGVGSSASLALMGSGMYEIQYGLGSARWL